MPKVVKEKRETRGKRISVLVGEEADVDSVFYANPMWDDEQGDSEFSETSASVDEFDSDFNETETDSSDNEGSSDGNDGPARKRKTVVSFKRKLKAKPEVEKPEPAAVEADINAFDNASVIDDDVMVEPELQIVTNVTKKVKPKKPSQVKPKTHEVEGPPVVRCQETILLEAAKTEQESATWLSCLSLYSEEMTGGSKRGKMGRLIRGCGQESQYIRFSSLRSSLLMTSMIVRLFDVRQILCLLCIVMR